jgi:hypothetical protein
MDRLEEFVSYMIETDRSPSFNDALDALRLVGADRLVESGKIHKHILGFVQLRIASKEGRELRIHHWPMGGSFSEEPHTHLWDLTSYVLGGEIQSTEYAVRLEDRDTRQLFAVLPAPVGTTREPLGQHVGATAVRQSSYAAGSIYTVEQGVYHTSEPVSVSALTLITTSAAKVSHPLVVATIDSPRSGHAAMAATSKAEREDFCLALQKAMG